MLGKTCIEVHLVEWIYDSVISKLLQQDHQPSMTGDLLRASLQALQVELGISGFPLNINLHEWDFWQLNVG